MDKRRIWGWYFFDWASQPYHTVLLTFVFGPFFASIATLHFAGIGLNETAADARAQSLWSLWLTIAGVTVGLSAPFLGAMADSIGRRIPWIALFSIVYVLCSSALWYTEPDGSNMYFALAMFCLGLIAAEFALVFTNAQLPGLADKDNVAGVSGAGFAFGYLGGFVALLIALGMLVGQANGQTVFGLDPGLGLLDAKAREGARAVGPFVALWFAVFMVPYFLFVKDAPDQGSRRSVTASLGKVLSSIKALPNRPSLFAFLGGSMLYRDALNGLYAFGGIFAALVLNWEVTKVGVFGVVIVISAAVLTWFGGKLDGRLGPKPVIIGCVLGLVAVCVTLAGLAPGRLFGVKFGETDVVFLACGVLIGGLGGTLQSASRTMMVRHVHDQQSTEEFGLYGLAGRATSFLGVATPGLVTYLTGDARNGVLPLILLFLLGLVLLRWVNPEGERKPA